MNGMTEQLDTTAAQSTLPPVLTIAGSDSSGGAGIQADLKTMLANGVFGMSAITAITAQNTMGVTDVQNITPDMVAAQIDAVYTDIPPAAVKIGMVSSAELICTIADRLEAHHARHIVLDPVMVATSGAKLIDDDAITALTERLFPLAEVITPNIPETEVLLDLIAHRGASLDPAKWAEDTDRESTRIVSDTAMEDAGRTVSDITAARCSSRAGMARPMRATCCMPMASRHGFTACAWTIRTRMAQDARCRRRSPRIWPKARHCPTRSVMPRTI